MRTLLTISVILGLLRLYIGSEIEPESPTWLDVYKDMAHVFIGGLGVLWWLFRKDDPMYAVLFWWLCFLEVAVAILSRVI